MSDSPDPLFPSESPEIISVEYATNENIRVLKGLEAVRERPGMYIGDTGLNGLHHMLKEIVDTSIDEVLNGHCTKIHVVYGADGSLSVEDNGRSISVEVDTETGKTVLERVLTEIGVERTLDSRGSENNQAFGGWHAVGAVCANALSVWLECEVKRDGKIHRMRFERGVPTGPLSVVGECGENDHGTKITWLADSSVFAKALDENGNLNYSLERISKWLRELAFLTPEAILSFTDARNGKATETFHSPRGAVDFVAYLNEGKIPVHDTTFAISERTEDETQIEVALQYHKGDEETIRGFANNVDLIDGGTSISGFKTGLTRAVNRYARKQRFLQESDANVAGSVVRGGMTAVIVVRMKNPQFESATKTKLTSLEIESVVSRLVYKRLLAFFDANPDTSRAIIDKIAAAAKAR